MITIVVSTRNESSDFIKNITNTCGVKGVEIIIYQNDNQYSLSELYNRGLKESKNNLVVFCHDDIIIERKSWGRRLIKNFENNPNYGILGVAGSKLINNTGVWWVEPHKVFGIVNHRQLNNQYTTKFSYDLLDNVESVVNIDGLFIAVMKDRIKAPFNENYKGFHFYDVTFCVDNYLKGVKIGVMTNIRITHKSIGLTNEKFDINKNKFIEEYKEYLPIRDILNFPINTIKRNLLNEPKLAIIIPTKNNYGLLYEAVKSIVNETKYVNYKIYIADTGSDFGVKERIRKELLVYTNIVLIEYDYYNFAKINNDVVKNHIDKDSELLLFSNNDIKMLNDSITEMVGVYLENRENVGTIGARLHYDDGYIQHLGVYIFKNKLGNVELTHNALGCDYKRLNIKDDVINVMGNTGGFLLINKDLFMKTQGFNESYEICFEDVELNLECGMRGKYNMLCANTAIYHYESKTRGKEISHRDYQLISNKIKDCGLYGKLKIM
jgi:GT2 family glycosyltransferase